MYRSRFLTPLFVCLFLVPTSRAAEPFHFPEAKHGKGELKYRNGLPVLTVEGTPEEIGEQIGVLAIKPGSGLLTYIRELFRARNLDQALPFLTKTAKAMTRKFPPDHLKEAEAMLKFSGLDSDLLLTANCLWDIKKLGCSALYVAPELSATKAPLMGRNLDFPTHGILQDYTLVIVYRPTGKHAFTSIGFPGLIGVMSGINDAGLCVAVLDVVETADGSPPFDLTGTPMAMTFRRIMEECTTVDEAEKLLRASKRTTLLNLAVCDSKKTGVVFELSPRTVAVRPAADGICACSNHFRCKELAVDMNCHRYDVLARSGVEKPLDVAAVQKQMHRANQAEWTFQTMVFEPAALTLHLAFGKGPSSALPLRTLELAPLFGQ